MKRIQLFSGQILLAVLLLTVLFQATSCKKEKQADTSLPELTGVTTLIDRSIALDAVNYGDWIILRGKHLATTYKVDFNSVLAADSLIYADDSTVTVKIPPVLPDPANNPITVTTKYGTATLNFRILQPPPTILGFDPMAGAAGDVVTITGYNFGGVTNVKFGSTEATIISSTKEEIKVNVPAGITTAYIYVTTPSGTVRADYLFGFKYEVFTEALTTGWTYAPSSVNVTYLATNTTPVKRGVNSLRVRFATAWGYLQLKKTAAMSTTGYSGVKFSLYAPASFLNKKLRIYLNNSSASGAYTITITKINEWQQFELPFINFGNPANLNYIAFNEFSGTATFPREIYLDDIGLY